MRLITLTIIGLFLLVALSLAWTINGTMNVTTRLEMPLPPLPLVPPHEPDIVIIVDPLIFNESDDLVKDATFHIINNGDREITLQNIKIKETDGFEGYINSAEITGETIDAGETKSLKFKVYKPSNCSDNTYHIGLEFSGTP